MFNKFNVCLVSLCIAGTTAAGSAASAAPNLEASSQRYQPAETVAADNDYTWNEAVADDQIAMESDETSEVASLANIEQLIFNLVNEERAKAGVPALTYSTTMEHYARLKSQDMGDRNYFSHADPEGRLMQSSLDADGVTYQTWGENLAKLGGYELDDAALAQMFMTNWMNSEGHRANILSADFEQIGVGVYQVGTSIYATQEFMR